MQNLASASCWEPHCVQSLLGVDSIKLSFRARLVAETTSHTHEATPKVRRLPTCSAMTCTDLRWCFTVKTDSPALHSYLNGLHPGHH